MSVKLYVSPCSASLSFAQTAVVARFDPAKHNVTNETLAFSNVALRVALQGSHVQAQYGRVNAFRILFVVELDCLMVLAHAGN